MPQRYTVTLRRKLLASCVPVLVRMHIPTPMTALETNAVNQNRIVVGAVVPLLAAIVGNPDVYFSEHKRITQKQNGETALVIRSHRT